MKHWKTSGIYSEVGIATAMNLDSQIPHNGSYRGCLPFFKVSAKEYGC